MGIFSYKCPECGAAVKKGAKFCPKCGAAGPGAVARCGKCGKPNKESATHCWNCGADLSAVSKPEVKEGLWAREPGDFAARIEAKDLKGRLTKGIKVDQGTVALLFQSGRLRGDLPPGGHNIGGVLARITNFSASEPSTVVLVDQGDITLRLGATQLFTGDDMRADASVEVVLGLRDGQLFYENIFRSRQHISVRELAEYFSGEIRNVLQEFAGRHNAIDLIGSGAIKGDLSSVITDSLKVSLERAGFELVNIRSLDFTSADVEALREQKGDVSRVAQRAELDKRVRETLISDKMHEFKSEKEFEDFLHRQEHELGIKNELRDQEVSDLRDEFRRRKDAEAQEHRIGLEAREQEAGIAKEDRSFDASLGRRDREHGQDMKEAGEAIDLGKMRAEAETDVDRMREQLERERKEAEVELERKRAEVEIERKRAEAEIEAEKLRARAQATAEQLLSIVDGPAADRILQLEEMRGKQNLSPDQLLAMVAQVSPDAARALAEKYKGEAGATYVDEKIKSVDESSDRMERLVREVMENMGDVAKSSGGGGGGGSTVVTGTGGGTVVVGGEAVSGAGECGACGGRYKPGAKFCPHCGAKLTE